MKKFAIFTIIVILLLSLIACSSNKTTTISEGTYTLNVEENEAFAPCIIISDGIFTFTYDLLSSYFNRGSYLVEDGILILTTNDNENKYQFQVKGDTLIFQEKNSSSVKLIDERLGIQLVDGDVLELVK